MSPGRKDRNPGTQFAKEEREAMGGPEARALEARTWGQLPALLVPSCVTLSRSLNPSVPQAPSEKWDKSA